MATTVGVMTTRGDLIHVADDAFGVTAPLKYDVTIRGFFARSNGGVYFGDHSQWRGLTFFQTADTVAPVITRKTTFPRID